MVFIDGNEGSEVDIVRALQTTEPVQNPARYKQRPSNVTCFQSNLILGRRNNSTRVVLLVVVEEEVEIPVAVVTMVGISKEFDSGQHDRR